MVLISIYTCCRCCITYLIRIVFYITVKRTILVILGALSNNYVSIFGLNRLVYAHLACYINYINYAFI